MNCPVLFGSQLQVNELKQQLKEHEIQANLRRHADSAASRLKKSPAGAHGGGDRQSEEKMLGESPCHTSNNIRWKEVCKRVLNTGLGTRLADMSTIKACRIVCSIEQEAFIFAKI